MNFTEHIEDNINIGDFLNYVGWNMKRVNDIYRGCCPFHKGSNNTSFIYNNQYFYCFSCNKSFGNYVKAYSTFKDISYKDSLIDLKNSFKISNFGDFKIEDMPSKKLEQDVFKKLKNSIYTEELPQIENILEVEKDINLFELTDSERFSMDSIKKFDIKTSKKGRYFNRIVFPIYYRKKLVGYSGRWKGDFNNISSDIKYLHSKKLAMTKILYNIDNHKANQDIIIHEGIADVIKASEHGYNAFSSFTCNLSLHQIAILKEIQDKNPSTKIIIFFDNDSPGINGTKKAVKRLLLHKLQNIYVAKLIDKNDAGETNKQEYEYALETKISANKYLTTY